MNKFQCLAGLLSILLFIPFVALSQEKKEKKFSFEVGLNQSFAAKKMYSIENDYGRLFYLEGRRKITNPFSVALQIDMSQFDRHTTYITLGVIPALYYDFMPDSRVKPFAGIGAGVAFSNLKAVFNEGYETNFCLMPSLGVRFFNHFTLAANYQLINKNYSHMNLRLGFYF